jgi:hypothetical protein
MASSWAALGRASSLAIDPVHLQRQGHAVPGQPGCPVNAAGEGPLFNRHGHRLAVDQGVEVEDVGRIVAVGDGDVVEIELLPADVRHREGHPRGHRRARGVHEHVADRHRLF